MTKMKDLMKIQKNGNNVMFTMPTESQLKEHSEDDGSPLIYVGNEADYNAGNHQGFWLNINSFYDFDEFYEFCRNLFSQDSPVLYSLQVRNIPMIILGLEIDEDEFEHIMEFADFPTEKRNAIIAAYQSYDAIDFDRFDERYIGHFDSLAEMAKYYLEFYCENSLTQLQDSPLRNFIDYEKYGRFLLQNTIDNYDNYFFWKY